MASGLLAASVALGAGYVSPARAGSIYLPGLAIGAGQATVKTESFQEQRFRVTVPQKYDFSCGSAALATLLTYGYNTPVTEQDVFKSMFDHGNKAQIERYGFSLLDIKEYLARRGFPSGGYRAPLSKLAEVRIPAITLINERGYHHFVVIDGIKDGRVLLADPATGMRSESVSNFESVWSGIFFVILSDVEVARSHFNGPDRWASAPSAPQSLARFTIDLGTLQQMTIRDMSRF